MRNVSTSVSGNRDRVMGFSTISIQGMDWHANSDYLLFSEGILVNFLSWLNWPQPC
jgi:hypothetical protein